MSQDHIKQAKLGEAILRWDGNYGESEGVRLVLEENKLLKDKLESKEAHCIRQAQKINEKLHQIRDLEAELTKEREHNAYLLESLKFYQEGNEPNEG